MNKEEAQQEQESEESLFALFNKNKKKIFFLTLSSVSLTLLAVGIAGLQLFYPYHFIIGLSIYMVSFIPLIKKIYLSRKSIKKFRSYEFAQSFLKREKGTLWFIVIMTIVAMSFFALFPMDANPFEDLTKEQITLKVEDDLYQAVMAMDYLESTGNELIQGLTVNEENANVTQDIKERFDAFLSAVVFSESLTEVHKYFNRIPRSMKDERAKSFMITYSLYVKKYEILRRVSDEVSRNEYKKKILNEYIELFDRNKIYDEMVVRFYHPKTRLRINAGRAYMTLFYNTPNEALGGSYALLHGKTEGSYRYLWANFDASLAYSVEAGADDMQSKMFDVWFPIQKGVANSMGNIRLSERGGDYFIQPDQIQTMQQKMEPGDIMLQRRNWYLSNVGIPGFWTHSALYTGTFTEMEEYFASEFPFDGHETFAEYVEAKYPDVYDKYHTEDKEGDEYAVIEAIDPQVVLQSMNKSAHADFVVVLRSNLNKKDKLQALFKAFGNYGKPYDYNFDFDTRDTIVCSELIFDAYYEDLPEKNGIHFDISVVNGRKIVSPLNIAEKFGNEHENGASELAFVYFIQGSEDTKMAVVSTEEVFLESIHWDKFSFLQ